MLEDFLSAYDEVTQDIVGSSHATILTNLERWFDIVEDDRRVWHLTRELMSLVTFQLWYEEQSQTGGSFVGSARLEWPSGKEKRLGMQLCTFKAFLKGDTDYIAFHSIFFGSETYFDRMVREINAQVFIPMSKDLRRYIIPRYALIGSDGRVSPLDIPAADGFVSIDHNQKRYVDAVQAVENVIETVQNANDYEDVEDKDQRIAELSAGRRMLAAARVRLKALSTVLGTALLWLSEKFSGGLVGKAAGAAWDALATLIGAAWHHLL